MDQIIDINDSDVFFSGKRKRKGMSTEKANIMLFIDALDKLELDMKEIVKTNPNLRGRKLVLLLNEIQKTIKKCNYEVNNSNDNALISGVITILNKVLYKITEDIKKESKDKGRKFNLMKYLRSKKKEYKDKLKNLENNNKNESESDEEEKPKKKKHKKCKKTKKTKKDKIYEDTSEDETSEEEYDMDDFIVNDDDEYYYDDDYDDDDDDDDVDYHYTSLNKSEKEFWEEFKKGNDGNINDIIKYYSGMNKKEKNKVLSKLKTVNEISIKEKPVLMRILDFNISDDEKSHLIKQYKSLKFSMNKDSKLDKWMDNVMRIPFGVNKGINLRNIKSNKINGFLNNLTKIMNEAVWGHDEAKRKIVQIMGQNIRNPDSKGTVLGIYGPPGNGKTSLIKDGISKALNRPFVFISLGGAKDSSFLQGHSYTYEGSIYGRIMDAIITSKCMNPIIYFDELDKISKTHNGDEIINLLIHMIDPIQNSKFRDRYFHGLEIDLSNVTFIFSYNDPSYVDPILRDRITQVETKFLMISQKMVIAKDYLLPYILKDVGLAQNDILLDDDLLRNMIDNYTYEGGVRKLKTLLYTVVRELNLYNLMNKKLRRSKVKFPYRLTEDDVSLFFKNNYKVSHDKINNQDKVGIINGLWANDLGVGGVLPIEVLWYPSQNPLSIKATGSLEKVIKESTEVAMSVAWNQLSISKQKSLVKKLKDNPMGIHIHCPEGGVSKDGPSAGTALSLAIYSLFEEKEINCKIAITGEINLQGKVMQIGGLEQKLEGAKRAGAKLALIPEGNRRDFEKILDRNKTLVNDNFEVKIVNNFEEVKNIFFK